MTQEAEMLKRASVMFAVSLLVVAAGFAKDKKKSIMPAYVLSAHTVAVIIDPSAGISVDDPRANQIAQKDVEAALLKWGRFEPVLGTQAADLVIVVRKGHGHLAEPTISDPRQNDRIGAVTTTDNAAGIGVQQGRPGNPGSIDDAAHSQVEIGGSDDSFIVLQGGVPNPLDSPPAWRYIARDGLSSPAVPAVEQFRKAVAEADKAAAKGP
jgi:hypothetical protein